MAFKAIDADAQRRWPQRGGTTATLAVACGWELVVANVGDSCAYLDTGSEVLQVGILRVGRRFGCCGSQGGVQVWCCWHACLVPGYNHRHESLLAWSS